MGVELEVQLIAVVTAVAAALPGTYLVLRRMALVSDAISHAILPGIVVAFFITEDLSSPLLVLAAAATGVLTVALIEALNRTGLVREDAAIGLVFPALFSIGVILISKFAGDVHIDTDVVLTGEIAFAPFERLVLAGRDLGPQALWTMSAILVANLLLIVIAHKELKLATVDPGLAALLGFSPIAIHYLLMTAVSVTAVGAFSAVGSILVVALMIAPPATAYLWAERLTPMLLWSAAIAAFCALLGYWSAYLLDVRLGVDVSIAGAMATACGVVFALGFVLAPGRGLVAQQRRRRQQRLDFGVRMLAVHLLNHQGTELETRECHLPHLHQHMKWTRGFSESVVRLAVERTVAAIEGEQLHLTTNGNAFAQLAVTGRPLD